MYEKGSGYRWQSTKYTQAQNIYFPQGIHQSSYTKSKHDNKILTEEREFQKRYRSSRSRKTLGNIPSLLHTIFDKMVYVFSIEQVKEMFIDTIFLSLKAFPETLELF